MTQSSTASAVSLKTAALSLAMLASLALPVALAEDNAAPVASPAYAAGSNGPHHGGKGHHREFMKQLNLSAEQKAKLKASHQAFKTENAAAIADLKAKHEQLKALGTDPANDAQRQQLRSELRQQMQALRAKREAAMQGILTSDQRQKWQAMKAQAKARYGGRHARPGNNVNPS